jgi:hypothetical protein
VESLRARILLQRRKIALALCALLIYTACSIIPIRTPGTYAGTVVDAQTGAPVEGAVIVVAWQRCHLIEFEGCGAGYSIREAITGPSGQFSIFALPAPDWNPLTFIASREPQFLIYAVEYLPMESFGDGTLSSGQVLRRASRPRIQLERGDSDDQLRRAIPSSYAYPEPDPPQLKRAIGEQEELIVERAHSRMGYETRTRERRSAIWSGMPRSRED